MPFQIVRNDITKVQADAIVNTVNPNAVIGSGVEQAIYEAAGKEKLLEARKKIGLLQVGEVAITDAFQLDANYIIHVSSPVWIDGLRGERELLYNCYSNALNIAKDYKCKSIAFPLLATGNYGFPKKVGIEVAIHAFTEFLKEYEMEITLVVFGAKDVSISGELVEEVHSYIDDDYVVDAIKHEYESPRNHRRELQAFLAPTSSELKKNSLDDIINQIYKESFGKYLQELINKKGLKNSDVYSAANISKQYFSKLLKDQVKPSKEKMLALAVGLRLNLDETIDFLQFAGYALSPISQTDQIVQYFIEKEKYSVMEIDVVLFDYGLDPLTKF